jgi:hypothetical protein
MTPPLPEVEDHPAGRKTVSLGVERVLPVLQSSWVTEDPPAVTTTGSGYRHCKAWPCRGECVASPSLKDGMCCAQTLHLGTKNKMSSGKDNKNDRSLIGNKSISSMDLGVLRVPRPKGKLRFR